MIAYLSAVKHYENGIMCIFSLNLRLLPTVPTQHLALSYLFNSSFLHHLMLWQSLVMSYGVVAQA